jgi:uncharacterized membrane protein (DUF4010 family)
MRRRHLYLRLLRASLVLGAVYDYLYALAMVTVPTVPARLLDLPLPGETFYLWTLATLLAMLGTLYLLAARNPRRYSGVIAIAIVGRTLGALAFALIALDRADLWGLWVLAACDLTFSVAHAGFWWPIRR